MRDGIIAAIQAASRPVTIMEVCGGHTHAICRFGLASLLPPEIRFVHGPGCPVCVIPPSTLSYALQLSDRGDVTVACFGDLMRVPTTRGTLLSRARGGNRVRMVYSATEALELAKASRERQVVFLAIGFETTAPSTAVVLLKAQREGIENFSVLSSHLLVPPALAALMEHPQTKVDAFIAPGHVTTVIGLDAYRFLCERWHCPVVVAGFEPLDIIHAVLMILEQMREGIATVGNQYRRAVRPQGNPLAREVMTRAFTVTEGVWRGLGTIPASGLAPRTELAPWDARVRFGPLEADADEEQTGCRCGDVLRGLLSPTECGLFSIACTPENPVGPCMVSGEGACAAYYRYGMGRARFSV